MAITYINQSALATGNNTDDPISASIASVVAGRTLIGFGSAYNPGTLGASAFSSPGSTWARLDEHQGGSDVFNGGIFYALNVAAGAPTAVQMDPSSGRYPTMVVAQFDGLGAAPTVDTPAHTIGSNAISITGNVSAAAENLALLILSWYSDADPATPSGWTLIDKQTNFSGLTQTLAAYYQVRATTAAPSATTSVDAAWVAVIGTLSVAGGAPPVHVPPARRWLSVRRAA
jgi:hypothetical protein